MGIYLNPSNALFLNALNSQIFVDKTPMISELNLLVNTQQRYLCVSRPRRFGKSMAASMLCAYYGCTEDNRPLFSDKNLAQCSDWDKYLGKFNVIRVVMTEFLQTGRSVEESMRKMSRRIVKELSTLHSFDPEDEDDLPYCLEICAQETGKQFVFIIDEWDAVFRELENDIPGQKYYLDFLRNLFKDRAYLALVYMTGILPVKKYGKHSALNMFSEYSMVSPRQLAPFTGFTADEVHSLCHVFGMSYPSIKNWYDGYTVYDSGIVNKSDGASHASLHSSAKQYHLYAPLSVVNAMLFGQIQNYWNATETFEALAMYIRMVFDGLKEIVARLMDGARIPVVMDNYQNDMTTFNSKDDVLTLLIHLGYLGYDQLTGEVFIPNREILDVFKSSTRGPQWASTMRALRNSQELLEATWAGDAETVAGLLEAAHDSTGNRTYNSEAALSYAVQLAYYKAQDEYTLLPEVDTGRGYADLIYIPKNPTRPALLVELKYRQDVDSAMEQIKRQKYPARLEHYKGNLILVGISYDRDANPAAPNFKHHSCQLLRA